jgi:hypothetical protein
MPSTTNIGSGLLPPAIFLLCLLYSPTYFHSIPKFAPFSLEKSIDQIVPLINVDLHIAYELGKLYQQYITCSGTNCNQFLEMAGKLVKVKNFELKHFDYLTEPTGRNGIIHKLVGFLSLANALIVVSVGLICFALGPILYGILYPLFSYLQNIARLLVKLVRLLRPFYWYGTFMLLGYLNSQSLWYPTSTAINIAFTWCSLAQLAFQYSISNSGDSNPALFGSFAAMTYGIPATWYKSSFLGFFCCVGVYIALGFMIQPIGLGVLVGWSERSSLERSLVMNSVFLIITLSLPLLDDHTRGVLQPFVLGIHTMGVNLLLLGCLIVSSAFYSSSNYWIRNFVMVALLLTLLTLGYTLEAAGLKNNALTYMFLYALEKYVEISWWRQGLLFWVFVLFSGCILWMIGMFMKTHPSWILDLFLPDLAY